MVQDRPGADQIVAFAEVVGGHVELPDFEIGQLDALQIPRVDVAAHDVALGPDPFGQPMRNAAVAGADLKAAPALRHADLLEAKAHLRVEHARHEGEALVLLRNRMRQNIRGHGLSESQARPLRAGGMFPIGCLPANRQPPESQP
jgi:hypothetical protein